MLNSCQLCLLTNFYMCVFLRNWGITSAGFNVHILMRILGIVILPRYLWFVDNRKKLKISYSASSVRKGTGGIVIFAATN